MKKCPYCAEEIQDEAVLCRWCGNRLDQNIVYDGITKIGKMICKRCGYEIPDQAMICIYCHKIYPLKVPGGFQFTMNIFRVVRGAYYTAGAGAVYLFLQGDSQIAWWFVLAFAIMFFINRGVNFAKQNMIQSVIDEQYQGFTPINIDQRKLVTGEAGVGFGAGKREGALLIAYHPS